VQILEAALLRPEKNALKNADDDVFFVAGTSRRAAEMPFRKSQQFGVITVPQFLSGRGFPLF